jgi:hypothetical protein
LKVGHGSRCGKEAKAGGNPGGRWVKQHRRAQQDGRRSAKQRQRSKQWQYQRLDYGECIWETKEETKEGKVNCRRIRILGTKNWIL